MSSLTLKLYSCNGDDLCNEDGVVFNDPKMTLIDGGVGIVLLIAIFHFAVRYMLLEKKCPESLFSLF